MPGFAADLEPALVLFDNAIDRGEAQASAFADFLGGEKWFKQMRQHFRRDAAAVVLDEDASKSSRNGAGVALAVFRLDFNFIGSD